MEGSSRLEVSIEAMQLFFPNFTQSKRKIGSIDYLVWQGTVQPIQSSDNLIELLDDICNERQVEVFARGKVGHLSSCVAIHHKPEWFDRLGNLQISYDLMVAYDGTARHPKAIVTNLVIPQHGGKHLNRDGTICAYAPWENVWLWQRDTVADFIGQALTWLIKWTIWCQAAVWPGREIQHHTAYLLKTIGRNGECRCGSGKKYKKCCLTLDIQQKQ